MGLIFFTRRITQASFSWTKHTKSCKKGWLKILKWKVKIYGLRNAGKMKIKPARTLSASVPLQNNNNKQTNKQK